MCLHETCRPQLILPLQDLPIGDQSLLEFLVVDVLHAHFVIPSEVPPQMQMSASITGSSAWVEANVNAMCMTAHRGMAIRTTKDSTDVGTDFNSGQ
jgi:hypothetical protein